MTKIAIVVYSDTETHEALGRLANALTLAQEAVENNDELKIIFEGAGTKWIGEMEKEDHTLHGLYAGLKNKITGACSFCAKSFGAKSEVEKSGVPLLSDFNDHPSIRSVIADGYQIVSF